MFTYQKDKLQDLLLGLYGFYRRCPIKMFIVNMTLAFPPNKPDYKD